VIGLPAISFFIVGCMWAFASPPGSSADDGFHMTSIWCAWGGSETCVEDAWSGTVSVPDRVAKPSCFALGLTPNARCTLLLTGKLVPTTDVNRDNSYNPRIFYLTLRSFVGPDAARSVLVIRFFNVALAAGLLGFALAVSRPPIRRALALGWAVAIIPVGMFTIASTNPSSWAIIGVGVFWAFLYTFLTEHPWRSPRALWALLGAVLSTVVALGGRSDPIYMILLSVIAVALMAAPRLRQRIRHAWPVLLAAAIGVVAIIVISWNSRAGSIVKMAGQMQFPGGDYIRDQPNAVLKAMAEFPSFFAAMFGGQAPSWSQRTTGLDGGIPGYTWPGYTYGMGYTDLIMPSLVGIIAMACVGAVVLVGFTSYSWRKIFAVGLLSIGLIAEILFLRSLFAFQPAIAALQPRYFFPLVLIIICFTAITYPASRRLFNRGQTVLLIIALALVNGVALRATIARYVHGQAHSWTALGNEPGWWWPSGPSPDLLSLMGAVAGLMWFVSIFALANRSDLSERERVAA